MWMTVHHWFSLQLDTLHPFPLCIKYMSRNACTSCPLFYLLWLNGYHFSDMDGMMSQITGKLFFNILFMLTTEKASKLHITGNRRIGITKGQLCRHIYAMTSSCDEPGWSFTPGYRYKRTLMREREPRPYELSLKNLFLIG